MNLRVYTEVRVALFLDPGGVAAISRGLSAAIPPEERQDSARATPEGSQRRAPARWGVAFPAVRGPLLRPLRGRGQIPSLFRGWSCSTPG